MSAESVGDYAPRRGPRTTRSRWVWLAAPVLVLSLGMNIYAFWPAASPDDAPSPGSPVVDHPAVDRGCAQPKPALVQLDDPSVIEPCIVPL